MDINLLDGKDMANLTDGYKEAIANGLLSSDVSEQGFERILKDDKLRKEYWDYAQSVKPKFYNEDFGVFSENVAKSLLPSVKDNPAPTTAAENQASLAKQNEGEVDYNLSTPSLSQGTEQPKELNGWDQGMKTLDEAWDKAGIGGKILLAPTLGALNLVDGVRGALAGVGSSIAETVGGQINAFAKDVDNVSMTNMQAYDPIHGTPYLNPETMDLYKGVSIDEQLAAAKRVEEAEKHGEEASSNDKWKSAFVRGAKSVREWGQKMEEISRPYDVTEDDTFTSLLGEGRIGDAIKLGAATAGQSALYSLGSRYAPTAILLFRGDAANRYVDLAEEQPEMEPWRRELHANGGAAIEVLVERMGDAFRLLKGGNEEIAKRTFKEIYENASKSLWRTLSKEILKSSVEEGGEEILTSGLTDAYDTLVDIGSQDGTGLMHQYRRFAEQMRKANPDIKISDKDMLWQFCKNKGMEYMNSFFGGFFSGGIHTSGTLLAPSTIQGLQDQKVQDQYVQQAINNIAKEDGVGTDAVIRVADGKDDTSKAMQERINTKYKEIVQNEIANSIKQDINNTRELIENRTNRMVYEVSFNDGSLKEGDSAYVIDGNVVVNTDGEKPIFDNTSSDKMVYIRIVHADGTNEVKQVAIDELDLVQNPITSEEWVQEYIDSTLEVLQQSQQPTQQAQEITTPEVVAGEQAGTQGKTYSNGQQTITASLPDANGVVTLSQPIEVGGEVTQQLPQTITDENGTYTYEQVLADLGYTPQQPAQQGQQPAQQGQQASSYPMTADGKVDWSQMDANQSMGAILERNGNNVERAKQYAERQVQAKQKALEEAKKAVEQIDIDDDAAYNAALDNVDKTQAEVDKWTAVANGIDAYNAPIQPSGYISATSASGNEVVTENSAINTENPNAPNGQSVSQNGNIAAESQQESGNIQQNAQSTQGNAENVSASAENAQQNAENPRNALSSGRNSVPLQREAVQDFIDSINSGHQQVKVWSESNIEEVLRDNHIPESTIRIVLNRLAIEKAKGNRMNGFIIGNTLFLNYDLPTLEDVRSAYVHERQHGFTTQALKDEVNEYVDENTLEGIVRKLCGTNSYDKSGADLLADEFISMAMEVAYRVDTGAELVAELSKAGANEELINIIKRINDEQRTSNRLARARRNSNVNNNGQENRRQDGRNSQQVSEGILGQEAVRPFRPSTRRDRSGRPSETSQVEPTLESEGFEVDDKTGDAKFSVAYRLDKNQIDILAEQIAERIGVSKAKAKKWLKAETSLAALCMNEDNVAALYYFPDGRYGAIKNNSDYPQGTVDFNNICRKRLDFTNIYLKLQQEFPNKVFTAKDLETIRQIMIEDGLEVACGLCYVEDRRQLLGEIANEFREFLKDRVIPEDLSATKKEVMQKVLDLVGDDTHIPTIYELLEAGAYTLRESHPNIFEAFVVFNNSRGMQSGRLFEGYAEYKREILDWDDKKVKKVNDAGGLRIFSFSDFEAHHLIDIVQIISDAAARGVMIQGYTKVPEFAKAIRNTKVKLNRSLIPLGDTGIQEVDGKKVLAYDPVEGIDVNSENFLDESNNPNVGNVLVGINDEQIRMAMEDANVDYIIPFHTGLKKDILLQKKIGDWVNYKNSQTEKDAATGSSKTADGKKVVGVNIYTDVLQAAEKAGTPITNRKEFVEYFLQVCKERGLVPRFEQFLARGKNGEYRYTKGYEKLLVDFKMFDKRGRILPQEPVVPIFDDAFNQQIIEDYVKGTKETKEYEGTMEKIRENLDLRYSISAAEDKAYLDAVNAGDMQTAQRMVLEAAKKAMPNTKVVDADGNPMVVYHDTNATELINIETGENWDNLDWRAKDEWRNRADFDEYWEERPFNVFSKVRSRRSIEMPAFFFAVNQDEYHEYGDRTIAAFLNITNPAIDPTIKDAGKYDTAGEDAMNELITQGHDGFVRTENGEWYEVNAFYPSQIKSAETVTYDDNGEIIPLSKRFDKRNADIRFSIIGEKGAAALDQAEEATTRLDNLAIAREMESANKDAKTIRMATGWERGADGKWRYEIEDVKLKDTNILNTSESVTLGDIVEDNVLFTAYPDMKDIVVDKNVSNGDLAKYNGNIGLSAELLDMPSSTIRTALIHEIQHAIQEREGFAGGVQSPNAEYFVKRKAELEKAIDALKTDYTKEQLRELAKTTNDADLRGVYVDALMQMAEGYTMDDIRKSYTNEYNGLAEQEQKSRREYVNAAGEVEARNASARANMSLEERINTLLAETEDVTREDQIFMYRGVKSQFRNDIRFSISNNNQRIFISNAEKAVESIKQDKATPQQWKAMIEKQGGLKAGEDKWLGLSEWLDEKANAEITPQANETRGEYLKRANKTITKQEVLDFITKNQIKIEEVHYAEEPYANSQKLEDYRYEFELKMESVEFTMEPDEAAQFAFDQMVEEYGDDFAMAFEYDENYRLQPIEDVFGDEDAESAAAYFLNEGVKPINGVRTGYTTKGLENNHEIALTVPTVESWNENDEVHFGDAGEGRAIAWIRFGETQAETPREVIDHVDELKFAYTNANGQDVYAPQGSKFSKDYAVYGKLANGEMGYVLFVRNNQLSAHPTLEAALEALNAHYEANPRQVTEYDKVLVIDEIQSKRHQEGREKGYTTKKNRDIKKKIAELTNRQDDIFDTMRAREEGRVGIVNFTEEETAELKRLDEEIKQLQSELSANNGIIPEAPFEKNWHELAFKRILRYAAENGFDKVAWTTGEQQAERYNLGKQFDSIEREDNPSIKGRRFTLNSANYFSFVVNEDGIVTESDLSEVKGKPLADVVGKDMAIRMMTLENGDAIEGADLRIGGEGMKGFYDKMLPSFVSKYVKKWGAKVGEVTMPQLQEGYQTMHSVDITPEMKESVMEGQPMFSISAKEDQEYADAVSRGDMVTAQRMVNEAAKRAMPNTKVVDENGDPLVVYHGTTEEFNTFSEAFASSNTGAKNGTLGYFFTPHTYYAESVVKGGDKNIKSVFLNIENPFEAGYARKQDGKFHDGIEREPFNYRKDGTFADGLKAIKDAVIAKFGEYTQENVAKWKSLVASHGIDGLFIMTGDSPDFSRNLIPTMQYVAFYPTQIKSADPATYDDNGNLIPLSERFNDDKQDIRFSIGNNDLALEESQVRYSIVTDEKLLEELENGETIKVYRAMQLRDGKLYPPMSGKVDGEWRNPIELGVWEQAEETPDKAVARKGKDGKVKYAFKLDKGNKKSLYAAYNPYIHTSRTPLNDQFSEAQDRPELVTVEVEVPVSELTSAYKAEKAKDAVGELEWKAGVVQGQLTGTRKVILSRYDKPIRIVPEAEVADRIVEMIDGKDVVFPSNVVTPQLRQELEDRGVEFRETDNQGNPRFSIKDNENLRMSGESVNFADEYRWGDKMLDADYIDQERFAEELELFEDAKNIKDGAEAKAYALMQFYDKIADAKDKPVVIPTHKDVKGYLVEAGMNEELAQAFQEEVDEIVKDGDIVKGLHYNGTIVVMGEFINSLVDAQSTYAHELQHKENKHRADAVIDVINSSNPLELLAFVNRLQGEGSYDHLLQYYADGFRALADETIAYGVQYGYRLGDNGNLADALRENGITNEELINAITKEYERQKESHGNLVQNNRKGNSRNDNRYNPRSGRANETTVQGESQQVGEPYGYELVQGSERTRKDVIRGSAALHRLRKEAIKYAKSYMFKAEPMRESGVRFSISSAPTPQPTETKGEYVKRFRAWWDGQIEERARREYIQQTKEASKWGWIGKKIADRNKPIEAFQRIIVGLGGKLDVSNNAYGDTTMAIGRAGYQVRKFADNQMRRMIDAINALINSGRLDGIDLRWNNMDTAYTEKGKEINGKRLTVRELIGVYCQAMDVQEAIQKNLPDRGEEGFKKNLTDANGNEVTYDEVIRLVHDAVSGTTLTKVLWTSINDATKFALRYQLAHGLISQETFDQFIDRDYYVPERGWRERDLNGKKDHYVEGNGMLNGSPYNAALKKAKGRESLASDPFAYIQSIAESSIMSVEKNRVKQKFLKFLLDNDEIGRKTGAWRIKKVYVVKDGVDSNGNVITKTTYEKPANEDDIVSMVSLDENLPPVTHGERLQHRVTVVQDGQQYVIELENEELANTLNGNYGDDVNLLGETWSNWQRNMVNYMSAINTQYNPVFPIWNFVRDFQLALVSNMAEQDAKFAGQFMKNIVKVQGAIWRYVANEKYRGIEVFKATPMGRYLQEYFEQGAQTGFSFLRDIESLNEDIDKMINPSAWEKTKDIMGHTVGATLSMMTEVSELTVRVAQYVTAREMGKSAEEAAQMAKEISVNFDRKGTLSGSLAKLYSFFNASIQGTNKIWRMMKDKKVRRKVEGACLLFFALGILNTLCNPDDPEEESWNSDYSRKTNYIIGSWIARRFGGRFEGIRIPVPHFFRIFYGAGVDVVLYAQGRKTLKQAIWDTADFTADELIPASFLQFNNFGEYNEVLNEIEFSPAQYIQGAAPSYLSPITDVWMNRNFMGGNINKEPFIRGEEEHYKAGKYAMTNTPKAYIAVADFLSGGDSSAFRKKGEGKGVSGSTLQHIVEGYAGGTGKTIADLGHLIYKAVNPKEDISIKDIPVVNKAFKPYQAEKAYSQEYWELYRKVKHYKKELDDAKKNNKEEYYKMKNSPEYKIYQRMNYLIKNKPKADEKYSAEDVKELMNANQLWNDKM